MYFAEWNLPNIEYTTCYKIIYEKQRFNLIYVKTFPQV